MYSDQTIKYNLCYHHYFMDLSYYSTDENKFSSQ